MSFRIVKALFIVYLFGVLYLFLSYFHQEYYWFDSFFYALKHQNIKSCRLFQVWVAPFPEHHPRSWIGGEEENYNLWRSAVEDLCTSAERHKKFIDFQYQIIVDKSVWLKHKDLIADWAKRFPNRIRWVLLENLIFEEDFSIQTGLAQCYTGIASVCSDFLRFTQLGIKDFERDCYMDIDLLSEAYAHRHRISSEYALGGKASAPGVYHTFDSGSHHIGYNCDLLFANHLEESVRGGLYADMKGVLIAYQPLYQYMAQLESRRSLPGLADYLKIQDSIVQWAVENPTKNINQYGLILEGIGPGFWKEQLQKGVSSPYRYGFTEGFKNYFSWRDRKAYLPYRYQTYELLSARFNPEAAQDLIRLNLCLYDYLAFSKDPWHPFSQDLKSHCIAQWDALSPICTGPYLYGEQKIGVMIESMRFNEI